MKKAKVYYDKNYEIDKVDKRLFGSFVEHLVRCLYGGIYQPEHSAVDKNGFREDVKEMIRELGVTGIRYPGGNFVSGYDWKDGIGPREKRPVRKDLAWHVLESNQVGINEFAEFAKDCGVQLYEAVNLGTGTAKDAAELIDYCNTEKGTVWSELRREHGVEEPHDIKLWYLGNEMDGEWQIGMHTAYEYARIAKETAKVMKWTDSSVELVACGTCTNEIGHNSYGDWDLQVLEECYDYIDYLSLHRYFNYNPNKQLFYPMQDDVSDIPYFVQDLKNFLDTIISVCDFVKGKKRSEKSINISFDEWGIITETGAVPGGIQQEFQFASFCQMDAVIAGAILCTFLNYCDRVKIACQSLLVNEGGMISTDEKGRAIRQAIFYPFKDVAHYAHGKAIKGVEYFPKKATNHHGEQITLTTACVYDEETGELTIFAANCDLDENVELTLNLQDFGYLRGIGHTELYHENPWARNTFEEENTVIPVEKELWDCGEKKIEIILKKHSWNMLRFQVEKNKEK